MSTTVTLHPAGDPTALARLPRRVRLSRAAVEHVAAAAGAPLPWHRPGHTSGLESALGAPVPPTGPDTPTDTLGEAASLGLLTDRGDVHPEVVTAVRVFGAPEILVGLDLAVRRRTAPGGFAQLRSWHRFRDGRVTALSTADGQGFELAWFDDDLWALELARAVTVAAPGGGREPPATALHLPHELLLGTGGALREGRVDLFAELVRRHTGRVHRGDGSEPLDFAATDDQMRRLHTSVLGRLQAVVTGSGTAEARRVGWVSWLLYSDGWRSLTPYLSDREPHVRLEPVTPAHLGIDVVRLVTAVRA